MLSFFSDFFSNSAFFLTYALIGSILSSISFGVIGTIVVVKRISYIAGAISHCVLGGIGIGLYLNKVCGISWVSPMTGAIISSILAAVVIGLVSMHAKQREDTVIGALWAFGMATGILFISKTPGYIDPMSYLFGNMLIISKQDLWYMFGLGLAVVSIVTAFYSKFLAVCFDEEFARLRGVNVDFYYLFLICLIALTVVILVTMVGVILVIALLTIPAAISCIFTKKLWHTMILSVFICMIFSVLGLSMSYSLDLSSGPFIIVLLTLFYLSIVAFRLPVYRLYRLLKMKFISNDS